MLAHSCPMRSSRAEGSLGWAQRLADPALEKGLGDSTQKIRAIEWPFGGLGPEGRVGAPWLRGTPWARNRGPSSP